MSGFVGIVHSDGAPVDVRLLRDMTEAMSYCGPDNRSIWHDGHVGLGHALLSAAPRPANDEWQPCSLDGRTWIAADARIDGRADLVAGLRAQGCHVSQETNDARLVLHAYETWGERCVDHLVGDFAFAIWDGDRRRLICVRDHFGVVPLYYVLPAGGIVVGNVLWSLRLHPAVSDALDKRVIGDLLLFGLNMDHAATTFADIRSLPPAHVLTFEAGTVRLRCYWEPPNANEEPELRFQRPQDYVDRFLVLFDQAVGDRLRADRVGTHLTGGMDSTSIAATAQHVLRSRGADFDLRGYTIVYDGAMVEEEGRYADLVAAQIGVAVEHVDATEYVIRPPDPDPDWVFPEPAVVPNQSAEYEIGRRVASFARGLLAGLGGDPLFHFEASWPSGLAQWRGLGRSLRFGLRDGYIPPYGVRPALRRALRGGRSEVPELPDWIEPDFARLTDLSTRWREICAEWERPSDRQVMVHPKWATIFAWSHPGAHGSTFRVLYPFFDARLVQYVWETPRYPWRPDKRLLREAMHDRLPPAVLRRPKTPLYTPRGKVHADDPAYRLALLPETRRWRTELLSGPAICEYVDVARAGMLIESPIPRRTVPSFENCFGLAQWLLSVPDSSKHRPIRKEIHDVRNPGAS